jgi:hypothetical protein
MRGNSWMIRNKNVLLIWILAAIVGLFLLSVGIKYSQPTRQEASTELKFRSID